MNDPTEISWNRFLVEGLLGSAQLIQNANVGVEPFAMAGTTVPLVTNRDGDARCSWVASLRNSYGPYARAETDIVRMNRWLRPLYVAASLAAEQLMIAGGLSGGVFLNNWLLATNLYGPRFNSDAILSSIEDLCRSNPGQPVVVRSLTPPLHREMIRDLAAAGFMLMPSRQVWIVSDPASREWRRHRDARRDLELAESTREEWAWVGSSEFSAEDYRRALELYQQLYRRRYPRFNPDYKSEFLRIGADTGFLEVFGLRSAEGGPLVGFIGMAHRGHQTCTPLLGYDLAMPASAGLYRRLMLRGFLTCERRGALFHCSAGAGLYKYNRGAQSSVEFAAVWANHLPAYRRAHLRVLAKAVSKFVVPYLETHRC